MGKGAEGHEARGSGRSRCWPPGQDRDPGHLAPSLLATLTHPALQRSRARPCSAAAGRGLVAAADSRLFTAASSGHLLGGLERLRGSAQERKPRASRSEGSERGPGAQNSQHCTLQRREELERGPGRLLGALPKWGWGPR